MKKTPIISLIIIIAGFGYYLYKSSQAPLLQPIVQPSPSTIKIPSPETSAQSLIQKAVVDDLVKRLSIDPKQISIMKTEQQNWSDGSLDCPVPGRVYTQATTSGYEVILQNSGKRYIYHISSPSNFVYCDR